MKLEAAAAVLGVAVDADPETLKAAFRRLALRWHPDKCKDADAKERFHEVSVAYTRLVSGESGRDHEDEGDRIYDDVDEMRAFMSMYMDVKGIFGTDMPNGCGHGCKGGHGHVPPAMHPDMADMPSASVAFSIMFGDRGQEETCSTEDDDDDPEGREEEDYDHEEEEFDIDEEPDLHGQEESDRDPLSDCGDEGSVASAWASVAAVASGSAADTVNSEDRPAATDGECSWEPMVPRYFHMNLKEEAEQQRAAGICAAGFKSGERPELEVEALRQARALKKRQDKKRRQKEKRQRESAARLQEAEDRDCQAEDEKTEDTGADAGVSAAAKRKESARLRRKEEEERRIHLFAACRGGEVEVVRMMLETGLIRCTERERESGQSGASLLHACVTDFAGSREHTPELKALAIDRLSIAAMVLACVNPAVDAGAVDSAGLTVLHRVSQALDLPYLTLLLEERHKSQDRRDQILLNERCLLKGWTPLHYAAAEASPAGVSMLVAAGANVTVHGPVLGGISVNGGGGGTTSDSSWADGGGGVEAGTALQLARALLSKEGPGPRKKGLQDVARQLSAATQAVERAKEQRERKDREAKLAKKRSEVMKEKKKEARERELLSRKQRQLKDKQERQEREEREEEERRAGRKDESKADENNKSSSSSKKAKKNKKKKNKTAAAGGDDEENTAVTTTTPAEGEGDHSAGASGDKRSEEGSTEAGASGGATPAVSESVHESSMSRDDLLAKLITMGFKEEHVHRGTSCVGFDLNALLSWLCEHPDGGASPADQTSGTTAASKAAATAKRGKTAKTKSKADAGKGNSGTITSALRGHMPLTEGSDGVGSGGWGAGTAGGGGRDGGPTTLAAAAAKAEEKRRHNLELRRINRAWNASLPLRRAEEEEKKAAETARERELEEAKNEKARLLESQRAASAAAMVAARQTVSIPTPQGKPTQGLATNRFPMLGRVGLASGGGSGLNNKAIPQPPNTLMPAGKGLAQAPRTPGQRSVGVGGGGGGGSVMSDAAIGPDNGNTNASGRAPSPGGVRVGVGGGDDAGQSKGNAVAQQPQQNHHQQQQQQQQQQQRRQQQQKQQQLRQQQQQQHHQQQQQKQQQQQQRQRQQQQQQRQRLQQQQLGAPGRQTGDTTGRGVGNPQPAPPHQQHQHQQHQHHQRHQHHQHVHGKSGSMPYANNGTGASNGVGNDGGGGGATGAGGTRAVPYPPGVGRSLMGPMPGFSTHGPHPAPPPGTPLGMPPMPVPAHVGHMPLVGQPLPFPGYMHPQPGPNHAPLQPPRGPRGAPPPAPHGYGASPAMVPPHQPQGPVHHVEWAARHRAAAAAAATARWNNSATVPVPGTGQGGPGLHPHTLQHQHPQRHVNGAPSHSVVGPLPWSETWGLVSSPGQAGLVVAPDGDVPAANLGHAHHQQQRQRSHSDHSHQQHHDLQRQRLKSASAVPVGAGASASAAAAAAPTKVSSPATAVESTRRASGSPLSLPDSPGSPTDISLAMQNGELSAAARVFVPTNISPAKPPASAASEGGVAARATSGATTPRPPLAAGSNPGLRPSPGKSGGGGLGLPLGSCAFGASWGVMGDAGTGAGVVGAGIAKASPPAAAGNSEPSRGSLWGSLGMDTGASAVPASGQAIWGSGSLLDSSLSVGGGVKNGDSLSLLLAPSTGATVESPAEAASISFSTPLALSSWEVEGRGDTSGTAAGDEFAGGLSASLGGLQLDDADTELAVGGKSGRQQQRNLFVAKSNGATGAEGELSWG